MFKKNKNLNVIIILMLVTMLVVLVISGFTVLIVKLLFPNVIPFGVFDFWETKGGIGEWLWCALPVLVFGAVLAIIHSATTTNDEDINRNAGAFLVVGGLISLWAGVMEEISFRWLTFLANIVLVKMWNFFMLGFIGLGIPQFFYSYAVAPIANLTTFGYLEPYLWHNAGWAVGASLLTTNAFFRDGHKYQGFFGWVDSWFFGMYCFWILFNYGLVACIFIHFLYDMLIFAIHYIDAVIERARGYV